MVGLFELVDGAGPSATRDDAGLDIGQACLLFNHRNLDELFSRLTAAGHVVVCPPRWLRVSETLMSREMSFLDPDGVMINCIERDPVAPS